MRRGVPKPFRFIAVAAAVYVAFVAAVAHLMREYSLHKTDALVRYAAKDCVGSLDSLMDASLSQVAAAIAANVRHPETRSVDEMRVLAGKYGLGELNFVSRDGVVVASSDPLVLNNSMLVGPASEFMKLTNRVDRIVSQPFRRSVSNPDVQMKYLGMNFPDHDGFVEVGAELGHTAAVFRRVLPTVFVGWQIGETGYYLAVDPRDKVIADSRRCPDAVGRDFADVCRGRVDGGSSEPYRLQVCGESATCVDNRYLEYRIVGVVPDREFRLPAARMGIWVSLWLLVPFVLFGWLLWRNIVAGARIRDMYAELARRNEEELGNARAIQAAALPSIFPPFPHELWQDVYAQMDPAREVGGDFYDFFRVSESRFAFLVADVSGKGVPAAMLMMKAKMLIKSLVISTGDLGAAMDEVNRRLNEEDDSMFVTCWIGVIERDGGRLEYVNAGHNPPFVRRLQGKVEQLDRISGFVLAGLPDTHYAVHHARLAKGDTIFLYTDGVSEAENARHEQFGEERIARCLAAGGSPQDLCRRVKSQADGFAAGASQFDDMTTLAFVYRGRPSRRELRFAAEMDSVGRASQFCEDELRRIGCPDDAVSRLLIAVDEIANNVVSYSGADGFTVVCETADFPPVAQITFVDSGKPWNPLTHSDPDVTAPADQREIGGLGIMMVKNLCDGVYYEQKDGCNELTFRVALPWRPLLARNVKGV